MSYSLVDHADRRAPRDPGTGVLVGAEDRWLGPEDADTAVLFVHGFVGAGQNFNGLPDELAATGVRVRVMLLPGHGTSPRDLAPVPADAFIDAVLAETRALQERYGRVVLVGHSMGGALCVIAAAETRPEGLVLAAPYFRVTSHWYYGMRPERWLRLTHRAVPWLYKGRLFLQVNRPEGRAEVLSYDWVPARAGVTLAQLGDRARDPDPLAAITCPVLLLHAPGDKAASMPAAEAALAGMINAASRETVVLERSNHHIFFDYDRDQAKRAILDFIARVRDGN